MPKYQNQCAHIKRDGSQCQSSSKAEYCGVHMYHIKGLPAKHKSEHYECKAEGCTVMTGSKYGYCSKHSGKQRYAAFKIASNI
jgi:hypothetical protein